MQVLAPFVAAATGLGLFAMAVVGARAGRRARIVTVCCFLVGLAVGLGPITDGPLANLAGGPSTVTLRGVRLVLAVGAPAAFFVLVAWAAVLRAKPPAGLAWAALSVPAGLFIGLAEAGAYGSIFTLAMPPAASALEGVLVATFIFPSLAVRALQSRRPGGAGDGSRPEDDLDRH